MTSQEMFERYGIKENKQVMITNIIPKGVSLLYGASGSGKTDCILKHLNRYSIKPTFLDFDNNTNIHGYDLYAINGFSFIDGIKLRSTGELIREFFPADELKYLNDLIAEELDEYNSRNNTNHDMSSDSFDKFVSIVGYSDNIDKMMDGFKEFKAEKNKTELPKDEVFIIDTYAQCLTYMKSDKDKFRNLVNNLSENNTVIIIAHEKLSARGATSDVDMFLSNHVDARFRLTKTLTKTKDEETYLFVEKLRGYNGNSKLHNWER